MISFLWPKAFNLLWVFVLSSSLLAKCTGRFVNPVTDICWSCIFPITLGGMKVSASGEDTNNPNPTPQTIMAYQVAQKEMMERSQKFSKVWIENIFQNPLLDQTLVTPVNQQAIHVQLDLQKQQRKETIRALSREYGLFYFFSSACEFCEKFAPLVQHFSKLYDWQVLAISVDGGDSALFPEAVPDNGLFDEWGVEALPALFAVNPSTGHVIPLAYGLTALDQIEVRVMALVEKK